MLQQKGEIFKYVTQTPKLCSRVFQKVFISSYDQQNNTLVSKHNTATKNSLKTAKRLTTFFFIRSQAQTCLILWWQTNLKIKMRYFRQPLYCSMSCLVIYIQCNLDMRCGILNLQRHTHVENNTLLSLRKRHSWYVHWPIWHCNNAGFL